MEVPLYFRVSAVARMLGQVSEKFIRAELERGRFFPVVEGDIDGSTVVRIAGNDMISITGVTWYLHRWCGWPKAAAAAQFLAQEMSKAPDLVELPSGIPARTEGELRRKMARE